MHNLDLKLVYVVEDDSITAITTKMLLEKTLHKTQVQLYANGQLALNQLRVALQEKADLAYDGRMGVFGSLLQLTPHAPGMRAIADFINQPGRPCESCALPIRSRIF
jgi:hypothetical protein